ncbi:MAG TPA: tripartite tricarboxylate transporter substrate binding protein [Burkholderiales bacterium]|jgi:tripartite-type tricarboxylate transporter receptor subunit TctC|nr:tripartite tricarboxylate transporter substrate binding protein [Burkholderiales bacterium]
MRLITFTLALILSAPSPQALAEAYPSKPIKLVIAFAAGSATDSAGRILAQELSQRLGQNVIIENRAGANGQIAAVFVARSAADGHTLFMTTNSTHGANPHLYKRLAYDPIKDFEPIARLGTLPFMLVVNPELPVNSTAEFIAYAKARPGRLSYGTASTASLVGAETINHLAGLDLVRVGYSSSPQAILDLVAGRLQVMVADFTTAMPHVKAGKLRVLAVTTAKHTTLLPEVPPIADTLAGFDLTSWNGIFAPAGTPKEVIARLERETLDILSRAEIRKRFAMIGFEIDPMNTSEFGRYVREQIAYWGKLVREAGIPPE